MWGPATSPAKLFYQLVVTEPNIVAFNPCLSYLRAMLLSAGLANVFRGRRLGFPMASLAFITLQPCDIHNPGVSAETLRDDDDARSEHQACGLQGGDVRV